MRKRALTVALQVGVVAVVFAVLPYKLFELDRYFVPKELVLHLVAAVGFALLLSRTRPTRVDAVDAFVAVFLVWSFASALFATNYWLAIRALGVSISSAMVFWAARSVGADGGHRPILVAVAVATVFAALTSLLQAYGIQSEYFSLNRAPGGTFGNRNFVAHVCAIGLPSLLFAAATARGAGGTLLGISGTVIVAGTLVLTRSRAAWLAAAACIGLLLLALLSSRRHWTPEVPRGRLMRLAGAASVGLLLAVVLPNRLRWASSSPYLESATSMVDYRSGSGRGRVEQYLNSARMTVEDPLLGVGPGNWPVEYVKFAGAGDASIATNGMTANPWPSSDWVAFLAERGVIATAALLGVFGALLFGALRRWSQIGGSAVLAKVVLMGTIAATLVVGVFDAALLLAAPALIAWSVLGATSGIARVGREVALPRGAWLAALGVAFVVLAAAVGRSASQAVAIATVGTGGQRAGWYAAAAIDPGSYRINVRVAELYAGRGQCAASRRYARRAQALFPSSPAPRRLIQRCQ
jgi:O-antigen ligase